MFVIYKFKCNDLQSLLKEASLHIWKLVDQKPQKFGNNVSFQNEASEPIQYSMTQFIFAKNPISTHPDADPYHCSNYCTLYVTK